LSKPDNVFYYKNVNLQTSKKQYLNKLQKIKDKAMQKIISINTEEHNGLYDITAKVESIVTESRVVNGIVSVYARGATTGIMIQENWDQSVQNDVITLLNRLVPAGIWEHDRQDNNGDSHLKAGLVGASETVPVIQGKLGLSTWQNIFFCEFDGPRSKREIVTTVISDN
jgi:secondary thiamine-phosphate synthase enzyme